MRTFTVLKLLKGDISMSNTSQRYDRKTLAFFLADLGEELDRPPKPSDLKKGMPSRSTFMRHFGDWNTALEYAGYATNIKLVNLLGIPVKIVGSDGKLELIQPSGRARLILSLPKVPYAKYILASQISDCPINTFQLKRICIELSNGIQQDFPAYQEKVYYIVPESVARNIYRFGRTSNDMIFVSPRDSHTTSDGIMYVSTFQMVYTNDLVIVK